MFPTVIFFVKIRQDAFYKLKHSEHDLGTPISHFLVEIRLNQPSTATIGNEPALPPWRVDQTRESGGDIYILSLSTE